VNAPPLHRQGEYVKPQYASGWAGKSVADERPDGNATGIVRRFDKTGRAALRATALDLLSAATSEAIRYSSASSSPLRGLPQIAGLLSATFGVWFVWFTRDIYNWFDDDPASVLIFGPLLIVVALCGLLVWLWSTRLELFRPIDEPTVFDRKHRKVYRIFCEAQPGLKGLFKPWPMRACEYDWDLIDAEQNAKVITTGSTMRRDSSLVFIVRRSADDPTIIDSFNIGNPLLMSLDETVAATYEHIRRFMEDDGPAVPEGESLSDPAPSRGVLGSLWHYSPFQPWYWQAWRDELPMMLLAHVGFPVTILFGGLWLFFNRLAVWTSRPIEWPPEVIAAVGPEIAKPLGPQ
jgi:hypothetical protein